MNRVDHCGGDVGGARLAAEVRRVEALVGSDALDRLHQAAAGRALDPTRSKPWKPWHPLTRTAAKPVIPGAIEHYAIEILATANLFRRGHRICLDITSLDLPTGVGGATNAEYMPYHICSSRTTVHRIFHDAKRPSHLLLPIIPT